MNQPGASRQLSFGSGVSRHAQLLDHACGTCVSCEAGWPVSCERPTKGESLCSVPDELDLGGVIALFGALSAFLSAGVHADDVVLAIANKSDTALSDLLTLAHSGTVLCSSDPWELPVKKQLAASSNFARADVVVTLLSARDGVLAVRRGGTVCVGDVANDMPSVTELAQREVRMVGPRDLSSVVKQFGRGVVEQVVERSRQHVAQSLK